MSDEACIAPHNEREPSLPGLMLCKRHRRRMDDDVREIGLLITDTQFIRDGGAPQDSGPRGKSPKKRADPPAPGDVAIMALYDPRNATSRIAQSVQNPDGDQSEPVPAVLAVIASWLLLVAEERPLTATALPKSVLGQLDLLARHHEWMAAQPFIDDYLIEMGELRKALTVVVRDVRFERRGTCALPAENGTGSCGGVLLEENGTRAVRCVRCRARWVSDQELARLAVSLESA